ncbi:hypothetical protein EK21DRAFT_88957 [Setomelanomma holmii]|uniref:Uncharacterized protein n=1 Tax=Setomelanomma holmii TaxID=210430 RepID=A0A9P4LMP6_9PLEO|nr:hypothetical protein EK21DRAFT_88957 [Setomelanomma holmii]
MARFQLQTLSSNKELPATPHKYGMNDDQDKKEPNEPCDFMPQSATAMILMSATLRRTRKSVDERALRLLLPDVEHETPPSPEPWKAHTNNWDEQGHDDEDDPSEEHKPKSFERSHVDIKRTPKTPPRTPLTPTRDTSLRSPRTMFSITSFLDYFVHLRVSTRTGAALIAAVIAAVLLMVLLGLGSKAVSCGLVAFARFIWEAVVLISDIVECAIEGVGWAVGRAVGRFWRGFERGYHI